MSANKNLIVIRDGEVESISESAIKAWAKAAAKKDHTRNYGAWADKAITLDVAKRGKVVSLDTGYTRRIDALPDAMQRSIRLLLDDQSNGGSDRQSNGGSDRQSNGGSDRQSDQSDNPWLTLATSDTGDQSDQSDRQSDQSGNPWLNLATDGRRDQRSDLDRFLDALRGDRRKWIVGLVEHAPIMRHDEIKLATAYHIGRQIADHTFESGKAMIAYGAIHDRLQESGKGSGSIVQTTRVLTDALWFRMQQNAATATGHDYDPDNAIRATSHGSAWGYVDQDGICSRKHDGGDPLIVNYFSTDPPLSRRHVAATPYVVIVIRQNGRGDRDPAAVLIVDPDTFDRMTK